MDSGSDPGLDLPRRGSVPGSVGYRRGRWRPGPLGQDVEHVEGAGAGGQSVSIGGAVVAEAHAGEGRGGKGAGSALRAVRVTPPRWVGPIMAAGDSLLGPGPRPDPPTEGTFSLSKHLSPLISYPGLPHPAATPPL